MKLTHEEITDIRSLRKRLTNKQLFNHINAQRLEEQKIGYTTFRTQLYKLAIFKCKMLRWTAEETKFLQNNYKVKGNIEIAKMLSKKGRVFTKKNINKKMKLLKIKRTAAQLQSIVNAHKNNGVYSKANFKKWKAKKVQKGETKVQIINGRPQVSIKVKGVLTAYARHRYQQLHGNIPNGYKVYFTDMNPLNIDDENLEIRKGAGLTADERKRYKANCKVYIDSLEKIDKKAENPTAKLPVSRGLISVRINAKTVVQVKAGTNIAQLKERYEQRAFIN